MNADVRHGPLEDVHRSLGAKLGPFGGWLMPIEYEGVLSEHRAVRERVGLFDLSHLGKLDVLGPEAFGVLQRLLTNDLARVAVGRAQYHHLLNDRGGVEEDLFVYRLGEERWLVVPNAANTDLVSGAIRVSVLSSTFPTQTASAPAAPDLAPLLAVVAAMPAWADDPIAAADGQPALSGLDLDRRCFVVRKRYRGRGLTYPLAMATIDYARGPVAPQAPLETSDPRRERLIQCDKFVLDRMTIAEEATLGGDNCCEILAVVDGAVVVRIAVGDVAVRKRGGVADRADKDQHDDEGCPGSHCRKLYRLAN